ncbi:MAG: TonB-dependent receptor [Pseudomonadota bacterium]
MLFRVGFTRGIVLLALLAGPAVAEPIAIDEIVVTAIRRPVSAARVSFATAGEIVDTGAQAAVITDLFSAIPGVALQQTTPGQGAAIIRGQRGSSVLHLVDGLRVNNAIFRSAPTQYFALIPVTAASRIDVVRGTPTSLYGSDAVGGAVLLTTHQPWYDPTSNRFAAHVQARANSAERLNEIRAVVDMARPGLASSVAIEYADVGERRIGGGDRVFGTDYRSHGARVWLGFEPDERQRWSFDVHLAEQPSTPRDDELVAGFGELDPASAEFFFEPNRRQFVHARYQRDDTLWGGDFAASLAWQRIDDDRRSRNTGSAIRRLENNRSDLVGVTATLASVDPDFSWVLGSESYYDDVTSGRRELSLDSGAVASVAPRFPDGAIARQSALYANAERRFGERLRATGGVRLSRVAIDVPASGNVAGADLTITDPSADLGFIASLSEHVDAVTNVGYGFRAPNVFDLGSLGERPGNRFNVPNTELDSERVFSADVGLRWRSPHWQFDGYLYRLSYDNRIVSVPTGIIDANGRQIVRSENLANSTVVGAEFSARWLPTDALRIDISADYTRGKQTVPSGGIEPGDRIPPLSVRARVRYQPNARYVADLVLSSASQQHRLSSRDIDDPRIDPAGTAGWASLDLAIGSTNERAWQWRIGLFNVTDARFRRHGSGIDAVGRNVDVSIGYRW